MKNDLRVPPDWWIINHIDGRVTAGRMGSPNAAIDLNLRGLLWMDSAKPVPLDVVDAVLRAVRSDEPTPNHADTEARHVVDMVHGLLDEAHAAEGPLVERVRTMVSDLRATRASMHAARDDAREARAVVTRVRLLLKDLLAAGGES